MTASRALELTRKALTRSPLATFRRAQQEVRRAARRPWSRVYPVLFVDRVLLSATGAASVDELWRELAASPFVLSAAARDEWVAALTSRYPHAAAEIVAAADRVVAHEFDLLGSGPTKLPARLPWHEDFKTRRTWSLDYAERIEYLELDRPTDVKVPWELSRCQHHPRLGQAYWITGDERYAREFVDEVSDWIACNPWGHGVNWACAMDVALRAVSWIWGFHFFADSRACADSAFRSRFLRSLYLHGAYIASHLETGPINGNHYLADAVGLVFVGCFFARSRKGRSWRDLGRAILLEELLLQVAEDGVDYEASTAYHRLVLELFLTAFLLLRANGDTIPAPQWRRLERMFEFVEAYTKPDGRAPLVGDADDGRVQALGRQPIGDHRYLLSTGAVLFGRSDFKRAARCFWEESFWLLGPEAADRFAALPDAPDAPTSKAFFEGGFFVLRRGDTHVFIDCGDVGMRGFGGHGHNDILSFELVLEGVPLVTDCGAYLYTASTEWRNRFRSTAFHSTIQIDGEEVNRFVRADRLWQLHNDARPEAVDFASGPRGDRFRGSHGGYTRLDDPVRVTREIVLGADGRAARVADSLEGRARHDVVWRFPLDPELAAEIDGSDVRFVRGGEERWLLPIAGCDALRWSLEQGWVSPSYGVKHETRVLTATGRLQLPHRLIYVFSAEHMSDPARVKKSP